MKPDLVWVHGWALGPGMWRGMTRRYKAWTHRLEDLGFFSEERPALGESKEWVGVGHSLGFLWLLKRLMEDPAARTNCRGLVSINGISRFCRAPDFRDGINRRILEGMKARCATDPSGLLREFRARAGLHLDLGPWETEIQAGERLARGLDWLALWDGRRMLADWKGPLLALASRQDQVVPPELTRAAFAARTDIQWFEGGSHMLPLTHPAWCAEKMAGFLSQFEGRESE